MSAELKSFKKGLEVYKEILSSSKCLKAKDLCLRLNINKSTMSRILLTLKNENFISYLDNTSEIIALDLIDKSLQNTKIEILLKNTKELLKEISKEANECAYLGIIHNNKVLYLNQIDTSLREIKTRNNIGLSFPIHSSALGKVILAFGDFNVEKIRLHQWTNNTITDLKEFKKELQKIREQGYSYDNSEFQDEMSCIGIPLFNKENILIAAVGISGSSKRISKNKISALAQRLSFLVSKYDILS